MLTHLLFCSGGAIQLMVQLMEEEVPLPPEEEECGEAATGGRGGSGSPPLLSPAFRDFVRQCMAKDPWARPSAEVLLQHPWLAGAAGGSGGALGAAATGGALAASVAPAALTAAAHPRADLRALMRCMYDEGEKLEDAVTLLVARLYNNLAYNSRDDDSVAAFYASDAVSMP